MPFRGNTWAQHFRSSLKRNCNQMPYCPPEPVCEMSKLVPTDRARQPPGTNIDATTNDTGGNTIAGCRANASVQILRLPSKVESWRWAERLFAVL